MKKYFLLILVVLAPCILSAQEDKNSRYLGGAVPEVNGKVIFQRQISTDQKISDNLFFTLVSRWAEEKFSTLENSGNVLKLSNPVSKQLIKEAVTPLVHRDNAFVFDVVQMHYQIYLQVEDSVCNIALSNITLHYPSWTKPQTAEELISDKAALNKRKTSMHGYHAKFRKLVVDSVDQVFTSLDIFLNGKKTIEAQGVIKGLISEDNQTERPIISTKSEDVSVPIINAQSEIEGFGELASSKLPADLISNRMLIVSGTGNKISVMPASWGGQGEMLSKTVMYNMQNPKYFSKKDVRDGDKYIIMFFSEDYAGALSQFKNTKGKENQKIEASGFTKKTTASGLTIFSEATMIIECKKLISQPVSEDANITLPEGTPIENLQMYTGEILNAWVKESK